MTLELNCLFLKSADLPTGLEWLSPAERDRLSHIHVDKRRADWLLGRWTTKRAVLLTEERDSTVEVLRNLEIRPTENGKPEVFRNGAQLPWAMSLSHREGAALCALSSLGSVGCDLEWIESRSDAFVQDYFTPDEQRMIRSHGTDTRALLANGLWSAKESVLKLLGVGLRIDTLSIEIAAHSPPRASCWLPIDAVHGQRSDEVSGWWTVRENWILTVFVEKRGPIPADLGL